MNGCDLLHKNGLLLHINLEYKVSRDHNTILLHQFLKKLNDDKLRVDLVYAKDCENLILVVEKVSYDARNDIEKSLSGFSFLVLNHRIYYSP